jgi:SAM-dependent methyltransferase
VRAGRNGLGGRALTRGDGSEFDAIAADYDLIRPTYPPALVDAACARSRLAPRARVFEIGCGTGQLTRLLAERQLSVDAVYPGARLIERARARVDSPSVRFHLGRFESVTLPQREYDAAFSATAFHWIDPTLGWSKVAKLLRPGGVFALLQTGVGGHVTAIGEEIVQAWKDVVPSASDWSYRDPYAFWDGIESRRANLSEVWAWVTKHDVALDEAARLFREVEVLAVPTPAEETSSSHLSLLRTTSSYLRLTPATRNALEVRVRAAFDRVGGTSRSVDWTVLVSAIRR